jgi:hypothetical protein
MSSSDSDHIDTAARALEAALARIGEPITEAQAREIAALEDCECKEGMFALATSRRAARHAGRDAGPALGSLDPHHPLGGLNCEPAQTFAFMAGKRSRQFREKGTAQAQRQAAGHCRQDCKPSVRQFQRHETQPEQLEIRMVLILTKVFR